MRRNQRTVLLSSELSYFDCNLLHCSSSPRVTRMSMSLIIRVNGRTRLRCLSRSLYYGSERRHRSIMNAEFCLVQQPTASFLSPWLRVWSDLLASIVEAYMPGTEFNSVS